MNRREEVEAWLAKYDNPMKDVVQRIREIILAADDRMDECIKWQAPTFTYKGNLASFFPRSKQHASLMFHLGAQIPGEHPRLEGTGDTGRVMKVGSVAEAEEARADLESLVRTWCEARRRGCAKGRRQDQGEGRSGKDRVKPGSTKPGSGPAGSLGRMPVRGLYASDSL